MTAFGKDDLGRCYCEIHRSKRVETCARSIPKDQLAGLRAARRPLLRKAAEADAAKQKELDETVQCAAIAAADAAFGKEDWDAASKKYAEASAVEDRQRSIPKDQLAAHQLQAKPRRKPRRNKRRSTPSTRPQLMLRMQAFDKKDYADERRSSYVGGIWHQSGREVSEGSHCRSGCADRGSRAQSGGGERKAAELEARYKPNLIRVSGQGLRRQEAIGGVERLYKDAFETEA
jgi:hypothetical protein